ncbi:MAG: methylmalonyl-CoA mutase [Planctomycetes bacterium]|nr:methylmalonyl-CoA mutase [Planctomycetota bacterium]
MTDPKTSSDLPVPPVSKPEAPQTTEARIGRPGAFPFARGLHPTGYRGRLWTMRQYAGFATAQETNARSRALLAAGQTGLSVAFDLPTQMGLDADHPLAEGEVGKAGVAISTLDDLDTLFDGIPIDRVSISMTINATAPILLAMLAALAERRGLDPALLSGTTQNDILKEYIARGTYIYPPAPSLRLAIDLCAHAVERFPKWNPISISGYHIREAGSTAAQELGFTLANGCAYVEAARARGLDLARFGQRLSFFFNAHNDFFEEIAKFRAARRLWAATIRDRFGVSDPRAQQCRFHTQTAGSTLTAQQPQNNVVRVALQAMAAVLGGTQSLHTNSRDEALALPTDRSIALALRTQQILAMETGVTATVDPLGGSWYVESLTDAVEARAREYMGAVDALGGSVKAIEAQHFQREIERSAYEAQQAVEREEKIVVGVNRYREDDPESDRMELMKVDPGVRTAQVARLERFRSTRDLAAAAASRGALAEAARNTDAPLFPRILDAVRSGATLGEISDTLREVFGVYRAK